MKKAGSFVLFILSSLYFAVAHTAPAVPPFASSIYKKASEKKSENKKWALPVSIENSTTLHKYSDYEKKDGVSLKLAPSYKINDSWSTSAEIGASQEFTQEKNSGFDQTLVFLQHKNPITNNLDFKQTAIGTLPTDVEANKKSTFQGALAASLGLSLKNQFWGSTFGVSQSLKRNFHEYTQNSEGAFNTQYSTSTSISTEIPLSEKVTFSGKFIYSIGLTYNENNNYRYINTFNLGYAPTKVSSIDVSISNDGNALKPNGVDSNIEIFNNESTMVGLGFTYTF